ncbi:MAG: MaoC family dehydratase [Alphaproteobacteria bacterium]
MKGHYFEHFHVGQRFTTGTKTLTEESIMAFAREHDPQTIHIDREGAARSSYGGIIASGIQTLGVTFRLFYDAYVYGDAFEVGVAANELRWLAPVRPGDTLTVEVEILETRPSRSRPDMGVVTSRMVTLNQRRETVLTFVSIDLIKRRPAGEDA